MTKEYENLKERASRGEYVLVEPLDYLLLDKLHEEGTMFAGLYPLGDDIHALGKKFTQVKGGLDSKIVSSRLRALRIQGLVSHTDTGVATAGKHVWQRTPNGTALLKKWQTANGQQEDTDGDS